MFPMIFIISFTLAMSFFCLRFPIKMWNNFFRLRIGPVTISEKTGVFISRFMGFIFGAIGIAFLAALLSGTIDVRH